MQIFPTNNFGTHFARGGASMVKLSRQGKSRSNKESFVNTTPQNYLGDMVRMQQAAVDTNMYAHEAVTDLNFDRDTVDSLEKLNQESIKLSRALDEYLDSLQETFVNTLLNQLADNKTELKERLHLHLSPDGQLVVEGDEHDAEQVCDIMAKKPAIQKRFKNLSYLAMLSHGVDVTRQACHAIREDKEADNPLFGHYHMYIKGSLSHFCVRE